MVLPRAENEIFNPYFTLIQGITRSNIYAINPVHQDNDSCTLPNGTENRSIEARPENFETGPVRGISLCQRLLSALISEEGNDELSFSGNNDQKFNLYGPSFDFETDVEINSVTPRSLENYELGGRNSFSGRMINSTLRSCNESFYSPPDHHNISLPDSTIATSFDHSYNGLHSDPAMTSNITFSDYQYGNMRINEKLLVEIQSIGLYPKLVVGAHFFSPSCVFSS